MAFGWCWDVTAPPLPLRSEENRDTNSNMTGKVTHRQRPRVAREFFLLDPSPSRHILDFRDADLSPVRLLGRYRYTRAHRELAAHSHGEMIEICFLESGQQVYEVNGEEYPLRGGDIFLTLPGEWHGTGSHPEGRGVLYWMLISVPAARRSFLDLPAHEGRLILKRLLQPSRRCFRAREAVQHTLHSIFDQHANQRNPLRLTELRNLLVRLVLDVIASADSLDHQTLSPHIHSALSLIEAEIEEPISLNHLASRINLSLPRFKSKFKVEVGMPPLAYILRRKIERASQLLHETDAPVIEIAMRLGFSSSQYFATVFKRYARVSPRQARGSSAPI